MKTVNLKSNDRDVSDYVSFRNKRRKFNESHFMDLEIQLLEIQKDISRFKESLRRSIGCIEDKSIVNYMMNANAQIQYGSRETRQEFFSRTTIPPLANKLLQIILKFVNTTLDDSTLYDLFAEKKTSRASDDPQSFFSIEDIDMAFYKVKEKAEGEDNSGNTTAINDYVHRKSLPECMNGFPFLVKKGNDAGKTRIRFKENILCLSQRDLKELITALVYSLETIGELPLETKARALSPW